MKKLFYLICAFVITIMFYSCEPNVEKSWSRYNGPYYIDTIIIHGNSHEIIYTYFNQGGGFSHSPECWCGK